MFPEKTIDDLMSNEVYLEANISPMYTVIQSIYSSYYDHETARTRWMKFSPAERSGLMWWYMNEAWEVFGISNSNLPIQWLALSKCCLRLDHMPSNLHEWALGILSRFNLTRYQNAHHLPAEEYEAIAHDLPEVLQGLREYPREKLAPPIDETQWGYRDQ